MAETELENAFSTLAAAFTYTENEIKEEVEVIKQQIVALKDRILELNNDKESLAKDKQAISEMHSRYDKE
jgi:prefoldin subunit 5